MAYLPRSPGSRQREAWSRAQVFGPRPPRRSRRWPIVATVMAGTVVGRPAAASGLLWILLMRNLTAFPDYTAIYLLGAQICLFGGFALASSRSFGGPLVAVALAGFAASHLASGVSGTAIAREVNPITRDFETIQETLRPPAHDLRRD
ncbi:MAG: hypothetical protein P8R42_11405 [Candidatus Binatia bacterium]|nr:hypothetical protein [Candidatus Binatia bacterium]